MNQELFSLSFFGGKSIGSRGGKLEGMGEE